MRQLIYTLLTPIFFALTLQAQEIKSYRGAYAYGQAVYDYYETPEGKRIYHGPFHASYDYNPETGEGIWVIGIYAHNLKEGKWSYQRNERFTREDKTHLLQANYHKGKLQGTYLYTEIVDELEQERYDFQMKDSKIVRFNITQQTEAGVMLRSSGQCNDEGFATDRWQKSYLENGYHYTRIEEWDNGVLVSRKLRNESTGDLEVLDIEDEAINTPREILRDFRRTNYFLTEGNIFRYQEFLHALEKGETPFADILSRKEIRQQLAEKQREIQERDLQERERKEKEQNHIYEYLEETAEFPGGQAAMSKYLATHITYPKVAAENNIQGRVLISFIVELDGSLSDIRVMRGVDPHLDGEAIRVISNMPKWIPGKLLGEPVRSRYTIPVNFRFR